MARGRSGVRALPYCRVFYCCVVLLYCVVGCVVVVVVVVVCCCAAHAQRDSALHMVKERQTRKKEGRAEARGRKGLPLAAWLFGGALLAMPLPSEEYFGCRV